MFDQLFERVKRGKVEFPQLAQSIGLVVPIAAQAGVKLEEALVVVATSTAAGLRPSIAIEGLRSPRLLLPNRPPVSNCTFYFGGELSAAELVGNACDYDRRVGGSRSTPNSGQPWTVCEHTKDACTRIVGDLESYGGDETVIDSTLIGAGEHKTVSTTVGNETSQRGPHQVNQQCEGDGSVIVPA